MGDFKTPEKILFYSDRTQEYDGEDVEGVNEIYKTTGDFVSAVLRIMPHANEPERLEKIVEQIKSIKIQTLSEYNGGEALPTEEIKFPEVGKTDLDIFENNFVEVMQFVVNHLTFDKNVEMDQQLLASLKPLGIEPGNIYSTEKAAKIDGKKFREVADKVRLDNLSLLAKPIDRKAAPKMFQPKGKTDLTTILTLSIVGPIGLPIEEAFYPPVTTNDGTPMNGLNDYVIKMTKEELPPAKAFWSLTLYDKANGFFIPNEIKKYSVGENTGYKLNDDGGIEIYVADKKPDGVPEENWLPIDRKDEDMDIILRIYVPDLEKVKDWEAPKAEKMK
jgi:hypothetical protein